MADKHIPNADIRRVWSDHTRTVAACAAEVGLTRAQLWKRAKALGLPARKDGRKFRITDLALFRAWWAAGVAVSEIGAHFGIADSGVCYRARMLGLSRRPSGKKPISIADFDALRLSRAMAHSARETGGAMRDAEMIDGTPWMRRAA